MSKFIGERLKKVRTELGCKTQDAFVEKLGATQTTLSKYEKGIIEIPDGFKTKISDFGINIYWLVTGEGECSQSLPLHLPPTKRGRAVSGWRRQTEGKGDGKPVRVSRPGLKLSH